MYDQNEILNRSYHFVYRAALYTGSKKKFAEEILTETHRSSLCFSVSLDQWKVDM